MKYATEMGSDAMIYTKFHKIGSGIKNLTGEYTDIQRTWRHTSYFK
jgi:hypothetical protein